MKISIFGSGHVGLVTGVRFAQVGHHVICVDNNEEKVTDADFGVVKESMDSPIIFDRHNQFHRHCSSKRGFDQYRISR